ncbi:MAG: YwiC-like family protein [Nitrospinae bacterium]|nr:YwiC-like family protein [Nitrospinota bacterium]
MAFTPMRMLARTPAGADRERLWGWLALFGGTALASFAVLTVAMGRWGLLWFRVPAALLAGGYFQSSMARATRTLPVEIAGIAGLALCGPAAVYVQQGRFTAQALILYLLFTLWFVDRMLTARRTLEAMRTGAPQVTLGARLAYFAPPLAIHGAALLLVAGIVLGSGGAAPAAAIAPHLAATLRNAGDVAAGPWTEDPMKIGFAEMRLGIIYAAFTIAAWRMWELMALFIS